MMIFRLLSILTLLLLFACSGQEPSYPQQHMPPELMQDNAQLLQGKNIFLSRCANCHGRQTEGRISRADFFQPPAPDFTAARYRSLDPAYLFWRISEGKTVEPYLSQGSVMPAWGDHFSDRQIWQLVAYLQHRSRP